DDVRVVPVDEVVAEDGQKGEGRGEQHDRESDDVPPSAHRSETRHHRGHGGHGEKTLYMTYLRVPRVPCGGEIPTRGGEFPLASRLPSAASRTDSSRRPWAAKASASTKWPSGAHSPSGCNSSPRRADRIASSYRRESR